MALAKSLCGFHAPFFVDNVYLIPDEIFIDLLGVCDT